MIGSLSLRERGLKCVNVAHARSWSWSLSLRERGLKYLYSLGEFDDDKVALLARAWIEIVLVLILHQVVVCRSPCESVD